MLTLRPSAVAGSFYPADPQELQTLVSQLLAGANANRPLPKALVAPHAGYIYSGPVAATAYAPLRQGRGRINRVVLLGPSHRVGFRGIALSTATAFVTPLGTIPLDSTTPARLVNLPQVGFLDQAHSQEHSLEVHLPFLQTLLDSFTLVPLVVGDASPEEVAQVLERLWGGPETLVVISTDLSHYHDYVTAQRLDAATSQAIEELRPEAIQHDSACGRNPLNGLLTLARRRGLQLRMVDLRNSGDTAGSRDRVVGYGAYVLVAPEESCQAGTTTTLEQQYSSGERQVLLEIAGASIDHGLNQGGPLPVALDHYSPSFGVWRAAFVTLNLAGRLRGCIGSLQAHRPLAVDVAHNAYAAAFTDPRFPPVSRQERSQLELHISILTPAVAMTFRDEEDLLAQIRPGVDGLILEDHNQRGTFLPAVWESLPERRDFLIQLKRKAGLPPSYWSPTLRVSRYTTESFP